METRKPTRGKHVGCWICGNARSAPFLSFRRTRQLGEAIGRLQKESGRRTLFIGSGGLSHHPTRYYPLVGEGAPDVAAWQLEGDRSGAFTEEEWLRLELLREELEG